MGFLTSIFGAGDNLLLTILLGLGIVLLLIVFGVWVLKVALNATGNAARGRTKRLAIIEVAAVDQKRQIVLFRRDDVEHLMLIGGATDVVVETNIPVQQFSTGKSSRQPARANAARNKTVPAAPPHTRTEPTPAQAQPHTPAAAPAPTNPTEPARAVPSTSTETPAGVSANDMDRLAEIAAKPKQRPASLRHTGLLRATNRAEPAFFPNNDATSDPDHSDSGKSTKQEAADKSTPAQGETQKKDEAAAQGTSKARTRKIARKS